MKHIKIFTIIAALTALTIQGCKIDEPVMAPGTFEIDEQYLEFDFSNNQETVFIPVRTNIPAYEWECSSTDDTWCKLAANYGSEVGLLLAVPESEETDVRSAKATVVARGKSYEFSVRQLGYGPAILVTNQIIESGSCTLTINVTSNIDYKISDPELDSDDEPNWLVRNPDGQETKGFLRKSYSFTAESNLDPFDRTATLYFTSTDEEYPDESATCTITQSTSSVKPGDVGDNPDTKVSAIGASASHAHNINEYPAENMINGDYSDAFQGPWETSESNPFNTGQALILTFTFAGQYNIDYFTVYHNEAYQGVNGGAGHGNGRIGEFDVYYKNAENLNYVQVKNPNSENGRFDFDQKGGIQTLHLPVLIEKPTEIKLEIWDGSPNEPNQGVNKSGNVAIAEIEFYQSTSVEAAEAINKVFTDLSCSELREGVSRSDISELYSYLPYLAQEVAAKMMRNTYPEAEKEFRIQTYKAYSRNTDNKLAYTRIYTQMDNPTGIYVEPGDSLMVCVDKIPTGHKVALAVYGEASDGYGPNYGSTAATENCDQEISLIAGVNVIRINATGMLYVLNTATNLTSSSEAVKVHVLPGCGDVLGYFDIERHDDARYKEMLNNYTYKYFMVKGRKIMFNYHVSQLRIDAPDGILSGITAWDDIVTWQHELMGLNDLTTYNNHVMAVSSSNPTAYMDASNRRVNFAVSTLAKIISREALQAAEDNAWGPAHELGHVHQYAIDWKGSSESSNNLFSNYVVYKLEKYSSRGDALSERADRWIKKQNWEVMSDKEVAGDPANEDTELHMRMNWQLWIYYHLCGAKADFWPTLFGLLREDPLPNGYLGTSEDVAQAMFKFVEKACDAAQQDLTEFFEAWGFFWPVDVTVDQYGQAPCVITENMVAELKARIAAKSYPKAPPIQYIEDRTTVNGVKYCDFGYYTTFVNEPTPTISTSASCTVTGRNYITSNCENAVAIEIRKAAAADGTLGELIYFSNMKDFTVPEAAGDLTGTVVYAVQADGTRVSL